MLLLVTGASGVGKSTVRALVAPRLTSVHSLELADLGAVGGITMADRQDLAEIAAQRAAALDDGEHLLLCGDPVAAAEVVAAPSAVHTRGIAVCLLDASPDVQAARLRKRGDPPEHLPAHLGFADWMREHRDDPLPRLDVLTRTGSPAMQWERIPAAVAAGAWAMTSIDASHLSAEAVADATERWIESALAGTSPVLHPEDW